MSDYAKIVGAGEVKLERLLPGPIERVWEYLTDAELRSSWFAGGKMDLRVGSKFVLYFQHAHLSHEKTPPPKYASMANGVEGAGEITQCDPPRLLAYTSTFGALGESEVIFELSPQGEKVLLVVTHRRLHSKDEMHQVSGGWHSHLGILDDRLAGREPRPFWSTHMKLEQEYERRFVDAVPWDGPIEVNIKRHFAASAERVFDAWFDTELLQKWMFGPAVRDEEIVRLEADPRVGGKFSFVVRRQGTEIDHVGTYLEIDRPRRLVFTWGIAGESTDGSRVVITIEPRGNGCELSLKHEMDPKWAEYADRTRAGWSKMLDMLQAATGGP
jgi:uncharacterized protein YndB with AHSA1/START domain